MSEHKSLIHVLEDVVLAMENQGETAQDIHSMVNMILNGWIVDGQVTAEYIQLAKLAEQQRQAMTRTVLADANGNPLVG